MGVTSKIDAPYNRPERPGNVSTDLYLQPTIPYTLYMLIRNVVPAHGDNCTSRALRGLNGCHDPACGVLTATEK